MQAVLFADERVFVETGGLTERIFQGRPACDNRRLFIACPDVLSNDRRLIFHTRGVPGEPV